MRIPASELNSPGVLCRTLKSGDYQITYNIGKNKFTLWKLNGNDADKVAINSDIDKLYKTIPWKA